MNNYKNFMQKFFIKNQKLTKKIGLINKLFVNLRKNSYKKKNNYKITKNNFYFKNIYKNLKKYSVLKENKDLKKNLISYKELICSFLILKGKSKMFQHIAQKSFEYIVKKYPQLNLYYIIKNFFSFYSLPLTYINKSNKRIKWKKNIYSAQWLNTVKERQTIFNFFKEFLKKQLKRTLVKNFQPIFLSLSSSKTELLKIQVENIKKNVNLWKTLSIDSRVYQKQLKLNSKKNNSIQNYPEKIKQNLNKHLNIKCLFSKKVFKFDNYDFLKNHIFFKNDSKLILNNRKNYFENTKRSFFNINRNKDINLKNHLSKNYKFHFILKNNKKNINLLSVKQKMKLFILFYKKLVNNDKSKKKDYLKNYLSKKFYWKKRKNFKIINIFFNKILLIFKNFTKINNLILNKNNFLFNFNKQFYIQKNVYFVNNFLENEEKFYWRNFINKNLNTIHSLKNKLGRFNLIKNNIPNYVFFSNKNYNLYWKKNFGLNFASYTKNKKQLRNKTFFLLKKKKTSTFFFSKLPIFKNILSLENTVNLKIFKVKHSRLSMFSQIKLCQGFKIDFKVWDKKEYVFLNTNLEKKLYSFFNKNNILIISDPLKLKKTRRTVLTSPHANKNAQQHFEKTVYIKTYKIFFISDYYQNNYYYYFNFMKHLLENDFKNYGISITLISSKI
jgi:hypothetical protein